MLCPRASECKLHVWSRFRISSWSCNVYLATDAENLISPLLVLLPRYFGEVPVLTLIQERWCRLCLASCQLACSACASNCSIYYIEWTLFSLLWPSLLFVYNTLRLKWWQSSLCSITSLSVTVCALMSTVRVNSMTFFDVKRLTFRYT